MISLALFCILIGVIIGCVCMDFLIKQDRDD